jgi:hypothetical protein
MLNDWSSVPSRGRIYHFSASSGLTLGALPVSYSMGTRDSASGGKAGGA